MILDGFGLADESPTNAVTVANLPNIRQLLKDYPWANGNASGLDVGLPDGQMGNSEVGHTNIGAGRIVYQELTRISKSIDDGDFFDNEILLDAVKNCKEKSSALHLAGLLSDGGVHSHIEHLYALLKLAKNNGLDKVYIHAFMDGRDTAPTSGKGFIADLQNKINEYSVGEIATITGRYYAMDRDKRWERVEKAYNAMVLGEGGQAKNPIEFMEKCYSDSTTDEFILPTVLNKDGLVKENDSFIFFNFRPDRARELTTVFCEPNFSEFKKPAMSLNFSCFTEYDENIPNKQIVFKSENLENTLGEHLSMLNKTQLRLAETEKYPHVTFFFNGGREKPFTGEDRVLVSSPKVATYDLQPEMSAKEVTLKLVDAIKSKKYDFILVNYANPDMVGHTGDLSATVEALEVVDTCVGQAVKALLEVDGQLFLCSDHGNCEKMVDLDTKEPFTAHTTSPVPFLIISKKVKSVKANGRLCDIAPTLLDMMELSVPKDMTGISLIN